MKQTIKFIEVPEKKTIIAIAEGHKAHAKCCDLDEFDPSFGKDLAKKRVLLKISRSDLATLSTEEDYWLKIADIVDKKLAKIFNKINYCLEKNFQLCDEITQLIQSKEK